MMRITVTVSDAVADRLTDEADVSAYVNAAVSHRMLEEQKRALVARPEAAFSDEQLESARAARLAAEAQMTPELRAFATALLADLAPHRLGGRRA
jgi:hypothetical protein